MDSIFGQFGEPLSWPLQSDLILQVSSNIEHYIALSSDDEAVHCKPSSQPEEGSPDIPRHHAGGHPEAVM